MRGVSGFTLVELIIVIVLLAIVAIGTTQFISLGAQIYTEGQQRSELVSQARFLILRLEKELRNALPNATNFDTSTGCLNFIPIVSSGTYLDEATDNPLRIVDFQDAVKAGNSISIFPVGPSNLRKETVSSVVVENTGKLTKKVTFNTAFEVESPAKRYFIIDEPVSICAKSEGGRTVLERRVDSSGSWLAVDIRDWVASYDPQTANVHFALELRSARGESLQISHEIHIANAP